MPKYPRGQNRHAKAVSSASHGLKKALPTWDKKKLIAIAKDRGYPTEESMINAVAKEFGIARHTLKVMLSSGRISWQYILCLGSYFEMSPREFCDTFLSGYFIEDELGHYRCHVDNYVMILRPPKVKDGRANIDRNDDERADILAELERL